jgi:hypothetical protein
MEQNREERETEKRGERREEKRREREKGDRREETDRERERERLMYLIRKEKQVTVLVLGCGKAGISCIAYLRRNWPSAKVRERDRVLEREVFFL